MRITRFATAGRNALEPCSREDGVTLDQPLAGSAARLALALAGEAEEPCWQTAWTGRGCFAPGSPGHWLAAKGVGPGPASERIRTMLDRKVRERSRGHGGCLRLGTGGFHPLLVPFQRHRGGWEVSDPRPEGFSSFALLVREVETAELLLRAGVATPIPVALFRRRLPEPWAPPTRDGLERFLRERVPPAAGRHLGTEIRAGQRVLLRSASYVALDGGVLVRAVLTPFRIADLQTAAATGDHRYVRWLARHVLRRFGADRAEPRALRRAGESIVDALAVAAAALFAEGILHGQLGVHHQNVTLLAELADLDGTVLLRSAPDPAGEMPWPASRLGHAMPRFWQRLRLAESCWRVAIEVVVHEDLRARLAELDPCPRKAVAACLLRQVFELQLHALRGADLLRRAALEDVDRPGTVLSRAESRQLQHRFVTGFLHEAGRRGARPLLRWALADGAASIRSFVADSGGARSAYGWAQRDTPVDHLDTVPGPRRAARARRELDALLAALDAPGT